MLAHLSVSSYEYTASIFAPEASLSDGPLTSADICSVLGLPEGSCGAPADSGSPLVAALTALSRQATTASLASSSSGARTGAPSAAAGSKLAESVGGSALALRASLETQLRHVDEKAAAAKSDFGPPPQLALQEHMLRYQKEADEAAAKQLQAELRRFHDVEAAKIRSEEKKVARLEIEKVVPMST